MIIINKPYIKTIDDKSKCICDIYIEDIKKEIWFEVDKRYEKYLVDDRVDAYVIYLLNYAMRNNHDIKCNAPVTDELLYNLNTILIPSLYKNSKKLNKIKIISERISPIKESEGIGTGLSCGIDSFNAIYNHTKETYPTLNINYVCLNNVGAFNECYGNEKERVKKERYQIAKDVSEKLNIELIETDSNVAKEIEQNHLLTHTYSSIFAVYMLQKLWKIYYYGSSGLDYSKFSLKDNDLYDAALYELLSLQCFSTSGIKIYSDGGEKNRLEKTKDILEFELAHQYLHVCIHDSKNCNVCSKCKRTLISLEVLNGLDKFSEVFDVEYYKKNKKDYYKWLCKEHFNKSAINESLYKEMIKKDEFRKTTLLYRMIYSHIYKLYKITKKVLKQIIKRG